MLAVTIPAITTPDTLRALPSHRTQHLLSVASTSEAPLGATLLFVLICLRDFPTIAGGNAQLHLSYVRGRSCLPRPA
jgi:hypothetical protein